MDKIILIIGISFLVSPLGDRVCEFFFLYFFIFSCFSKAREAVKELSEVNNQLKKNEEYSDCSGLCNPIGRVDKELSEALAEDRAEYHLGQDAG
ncbi:MAG: hypothetical protein J6M19_00015 [Bacteroidaceae bacterium]|nr:hypothetical protein [Bacteroidaceae bacterium]